MTTIKNVCPGVLLIADRHLRLAPGQAVELESLSPETERAIALGLLIEAGKEKAPPKETAKPTPTPVVPAAEAIPEEPAASTPVDDLSKVSPSEALDRIAAEGDANRLRGWLATERRRGIADTIRKRLAELTGGAR